MNIFSNVVVKYSERIIDFYINITNNNDECIEFLNQIKNNLNGRESSKSFKLLIASMIFTSTKFSLDNLVYLIIQNLNGNIDSTYLDSYIDNQLSIVCLNAKNTFNFLSEFSNIYIENEDKTNLNDNEIFSLFKLQENIFNLIKNNGNNMRIIKSIKTLRNNSLESNPNKVSINKSRKINIEIIKNMINIYKNEFYNYEEKQDSTDSETIVYDQRRYFNTVITPEYRELFNQIPIEYNISDYESRIAELDRRIAIWKTK